MKPIIKIENLSKQYRLGTIGTGTLSNDMKRWWYKIRGKEDPFLKIGESNDRSVKGNSEYVWALRDINLEVMPGEVLGIIGKNGAGKSTLLKILSKVTGPTTGKIHFNGRIGSLLEVGTGFHPELTGRENIFLNGAILGMTKSEIRGKLDEIIDFSGCERYIDTPVKRYSSGMMVRLGFAVAAHLEPEILVVDEVLAVGDVEFQRKAIGKMQDVSKNEGRTILFVSHNMVAIDALCSKAILLNNGIIYNMGATKQTIQKYFGMQTSIRKQKIINRQDREGDNSIKLNACRINGIDIGKSPVINTGSKVVIELDYISDKILVFPNFWISFYDENERPVFKCNSETVPFQINELPPQGTVACIIPKLQLLQGEYTLNIAVQQKNEIADRIENIGLVKVEKGIYHNSDKTSTYEGVFVAEYSWSLK